MTAKSISEEELQLRKRARRRLIGAIALVTIVAVFLPMVLDHEPKPVSQDVSIQIPSPNAGTFTSKIVPVVPGTVTKSRDKPGSESSARREEAGAPAVRPDVVPPAYDTEAAPPLKADAEKPTAQAKTPSKPLLKAAPVTMSAEKPKASPDQTKADAKDPGSFVVQVAALNDADKARQMQEQIAAAGVKSYTEVVPTTKGSVTRVRAGPFASRDEAEKVRDKLKDMGLNGNIAPK